LAIAAQEWLKANDLSNKLEAFVVAAAGNIDEDNVLFPVDPIGSLLNALSGYLNSEGTRKIEYLAYLKRCKKH
jgi:hypothetical protein